MHGALAEAAVRLFAISYDAVGVLRTFAERHGIAYPLLSDEGSRAMRGLGLVNDRVQEDHAVYGIAPNPRHLGVAHPGVFVLDEAGLVVDKRFHQSYRERDTGAGLLAETLGLIVPPAETSAATPPGGAVQVRAWLDAPSYIWFQRVRLVAEVTVAPGFHVYASPAPEGMTPLSIEVEPVDGVEMGAPAWPAPVPLDPIGPEGGELLGYEGTIRGSLPLTFTAAPGAGGLVIRASVAYQACDATSCLLPASVRLELPIQEAALVDRALPPRTP